MCVEVDCLTGAAALVAGENEGNCDDGRFRFSFGVAESHTNRNAAMRSVDM